MNILICGASGFIGNAIFHSLVDKYNVIICGRTSIDGYNNFIYADFTQENNWDKIIDEIDLVINAVGIIDGDFNNVQTDTPVKLFKACIKKNIKIIQISAIGAEKNYPNIPYLKSKQNADSVLLDYNNAKIIYPGIVLGKNGKSSQFFAELASWPIVPNLTSKEIPFVNINQLIQIILKTITEFEQSPKQIFTVAKSVSIKSVLQKINPKKKIFIPFPQFILKILFVLFPRFSFGIFNKNMFSLLMNVKSNEYLPLFNNPFENIDFNNQPKSNYLGNALSLFAISFIFIWSAISSLIQWDTSLQLMHEIGANDNYAFLFIYLGCFADFFLGVAMFNKKIRKPILVLQIVFILIYTLILSVFAPSYWLHPLGVLSKNIPLLVLIIIQLTREK